MSFIGILVLVILVVLAVWLITQVGLQEPFRTILIVIMLVIVLIGALSVFGLLPSGRILMR